MKYVSSNPSTVIQKKTKLILLSIGLLLVVNTILILTLLLDPSASNKKLNFRQAAKASDDLNVRPATMTTFKDLMSGYSAQYDASLWQLSETMKGAVKKQTFLMNSEFGNAVIEIATYPKTSTTVKADIVAALPDGESVTTETTGERWRLPHTKLTITDTTLFTPNEYFIYLVAADKWQFAITVKAPSVGQSTTYTERFLDSIVLQPNDVQGESDTVQTADEVRVAAIAKPSVVNVLYLQCNTLSFEASAAANLKYLKKEYPYCFGGKGTGFFVSDQGHVATNGHVVKSFPEQSVIDGVLQIPELQQFLVDYLSELSYQKNQKEIVSSRIVATVESLVTNPNKLDSLFKTFYESLENGSMKIVEGQPQYYVKLTDEPFLFSDNQLTSTTSATYVVMSDAVREADLVTINFADYYSFKTTQTKTAPKGSDVALLKLKGTGQTYPALPLFEGQVQEGQPIIVIGYPVLTEGERTSQNGVALVDYYTSSGSQTVTRGVISAFKQDMGGNLLLQTDASIERGNSGGPALIQGGSVIGVATYAFLSQSGNYNFLRDINDVKKLMEAKGVSIGDNQAYLDWKDGLTAYWEGNYDVAASKLTAAAESYPYNPLLTNYLTEVKAELENPERVFDTASGSAVTKVQQILQTSSPSQLGIYAAMAGVTAFFLILIIIQSIQIQGLRKSMQEAVQAVQSPPPPSIPTSTMVIPPDKTIV